MKPNFKKIKKKKKKKKKKKNTLNQTYGRKVIHAFYIVRRSQNIKPMSIHINEKIKREKEVS